VAGSRIHFAGAVSRLLPVGQFILAAWVATTAAADPPGILGTNELDHLDRALSCLATTRADMGFDKDHGEPLLVLEMVDRMLDEPLQLSVLGDGLLGALRQEGWAATWEFSRAIYGVGPDRAATGPVDAAVLTVPLKGTEMEQVLTPFVASLARARLGVEDAFSDLSGDDRRFVAAADLGDIFDAEDKPDVWRGLIAMGVTTGQLTRAIDMGNRVDPEPGSSNYLAAIERLNLHGLLDVGQELQGAALTLMRAAQGVRAWPTQQLVMVTAGGPVIIGTPGDDIYDQPAALILDPSGDDRYAPPASSANGLLDRPVNVVIDLAGDDYYGGADLVGAGTALIGVHLLLDAAGDDTYRTRGAGQGAAIFGVAVVEDMRGNDIYSAKSMAQGAASAGLGILRDRMGHDIYHVGSYGQGFAGVFGVGYLVDDRGNDQFLTGGHRPDHERLPAQTQSLSQGFSIGMRPFGGGGVGALVDLGGNDHYKADMFGQGASYWYAIGLLLDTEGNDSYSMHMYGQGAGIHMGLGLLYDRVGDDVYTGFNLSQGMGHDYSVGMLIDRRGNDTYTANTSSQGMGIYNALGLLLDAAGNDAYLGRDPDTCQGIGQNGGTREYGSLAILMDLEGADRYTCPATDGARLLRPYYGIVYDVKEP
jgi:hypothetical protein